MNSKQQSDFKMSLSTHSPDIAKEWDYIKNGSLKPDSIGYGSTQKVYWICENGHSYRTRVDHRTIMHSGCPYCHGKLPIHGKNDLKTVYPDIAKEWDYDKNEKSGAPEIKQAPQFFHLF